MSVYARGLQALSMSVCARGLQALSMSVYARGPSSRVTREINSLPELSLSFTQQMHQVHSIQHSSSCTHCLVHALNLACGTADVGQRLYQMHYDATYVTSNQLSNNPKKCGGECRESR